MFDFLAELVAGILPVDTGSKSSPYRAYLRAWKSRSTGQGTETQLLIDELKESSVPGAYGPWEKPPLSLLIQAWEVEMPPAEARRRYGRDFSQVRPD